MTDKEVIIDGVNVAGCEFAEESATTPKCRINGYIHCDGCNCYYKQLQRLQRENEELKKKLKSYTQGWIECDKERNLQEANSEFRQRVINRYKQALEEIRKIVINYDDWDLTKLVQDKINEVLKDE